MDQKTLERSVLGRKTAMSVFGYNAVPWLFKNLHRVPCTKVMSWDDPDRVFIR